MTGMKYGLLLFDVPHADDERDRALHEGLRTWHGRLDEVVVPEEVKHWREWLGTIHWEEVVEHEKQLVFASLISERPDVTDAEDNLLSERLVLAWRALQLTDLLRPLSGRGTIITGALRTDASDGRPRLRSVRRHEQTETLPRPFYASRPPFYEQMPWAEGDPWMTRWAASCAMLAMAEAESVPEILHMAMLAFSSGLSRGELEFRVPDLVRAAECILALPRTGGGRQKFADRAMQILRGVESHWFVGSPDLHERLVELYQHRNDCVHGKIPFLELRDRGDAGADEAARAEYLAELAAREALRAALSRPQSFSELASRDRLEDAWEHGRFP